MLGVGASKFWQLVKNEEIEVIRLGPNLTLVPISSLHDFLARHSKRRSDDGKRQASELHDVP